MMWMAWRQHRRQVLFALAGLVVLAAALIPTGLAMRSDFTGSGLAACIEGLGSSEFLQQGKDCTALSREFTGTYDLTAMFGTLLVFLPLLVGIFWGAPLIARELEQGTYRLVWTQGVSRLRWTLVKTAFVVVVTVAVSACYALMLTWWLTPLNEAGRVRLAELNFDVQGVVPIAYTLFAVALGILAGTIWRRVTPAMAAAVVGFLTVRVIVLSQLRGHLLPTSERIYPVVGGRRPNPALGDWTFASGIKNAQGEVVVSGQQAQCGAGVSGDPTGPCAAFGDGAYNFQLYQPGSNFWPLQFIEAGLFTLLAVVLIYLAVRQIRYRIA